MLLSKTSLYCVEDEYPFCMVLPRTKWSWIRKANILTYLETTFEHSKALSRAKYFPSNLWQIIQWYPRKSVSFSNLQLPNICNEIVQHFVKINVFLLHITHIIHFSIDLLFRITWRFALLRESGNWWSFHKINRQPLGNVYMTMCRIAYHLKFVVNL